MATKKFKKLPKDAQRAAFAQMDKDGTRESGGGKKLGGGSIAVKTLNPSSAKFPHIKSGEQSAMLSKSLRHFERAVKTERERMLSGLEFGEIRAEQNLRNRENTFSAMKGRKEGRDFLSTARAFRIKNSKK